MVSGSELVSIIIPVRNGERFISRTLTSACAQTYHPLEIIVVDDGSTDRTHEIVETEILKDKRIRLFRRPPSGLPATRNYAISQASGDLIAPLDGDDLWHPKKIEKQVEAMNEAAAVGLVYCWTVDIDELDFVIPPIRSKKIAEGKVLFDVIANAGIIESGSNPLIRRSFLEATGCYDPQMIYGAEDWKMSLALAEVCEFRVVREHLVGYRQASATMSKNIAAMQRAFESVSQWIEERWPHTPKDIKQRMRYNMNAYLAHQALANHQFGTALRYQIDGYRACPQSLVTRAGSMSLLRLLLRSLGLRRRDLPIQQKRQSFAEFCQSRAS